MHSRCLKNILVLLIVLPGMLSAAADLPDHPDPRRVLLSHYAAIGGLSRLKELKTWYSEGEIVYDGLKGRFKQWEALPIQYRLEERYAPFNQVSGDDGRNAWFRDANGKVLIQKDADTVKRREIEIRLNRFEHLEPDTDFFSLAYKGTALVKGSECHVIEIRNRLNPDTIRHFFHSSTFYLLRTVFSQPDMTIDTHYDDFRDISGIVRPFLETTHIHPQDKRIISRIAHMIANPPIPENRFHIPLDLTRRHVHFEDGRACTQAPFQFIENLMYLPVQIGCETRFWLLDTGASMSVIDAEYAREIGLTPQGHLKGHGFGGNFDLSVVTLPPFKVGCVRVDAQKAFSYEGLAEGFYEPRAVGILGFDFLSRFVVRIDYARQTISFFDPAGFTYTGNGALLEAPLKYKTFCFTATVNKRYSGKWTLDLGAFNTSFHHPFAKKHNLLERKGVDRVSRGVSGEYLERTLRFDTFRIGPYQIQAPRISVPLQPDAGAATRGETIGNIGNSILRHFVLYLDYARQAVIFEPGADFNHSPPEDKSGLVIGKSETGLPVIVFIASGTPAQDAGLLPGDVITRINDINVTYFQGIVSICRLLREQAGTQYTLTVQRGNATQKIRLKLRELY